MCLYRQSRQLGSHLRNLGLYLCLKYLYCWSKSGFRELEVSVLCFRLYGMCHLKLPIKKTLAPQDVGLGSKSNGCKIPAQRMCLPYLLFHFSLQPQIHHLSERNSVLLPMTPLQSTGSRMMSSASAPMSFSTPYSLARLTSSVSHGVVGACGQR